MCRNVRKRTFGHVHIRAVWSESSQGALWTAKDEKFFLRTQVRYADA